MRTSSEERATKRSCHSHAAALAICVALLIPSGARAHRCTGDCDSSDTVSVSELIVGVRIALEQTPLFTCLSFDADIDHRVSINELLVAVNNAFSFCGHGIPTATPSGEVSTATPTPGVTQTPTDQPGESATPTITGEPGP